MAHAATIRWSDPEAFEANLTRALVAGMLAGAAQLSLEKLGVLLPGALLPLLAATWACARGDRLDRSLLVLLAAVFVSSPYALGLAPAWALAVAGMAAGALMVRARACDRGEERSLAVERPGGVHAVLGAGAVALLALAGDQVGSVLGAWLERSAAPALLPPLVKGAALGLFAGIGSAGGHLFLLEDPVEARGAELLPALTGELRRLGERVLGLYRACGACLALLPRDPSREVLAGGLSRLTQEALGLAADWSSLDEALASSGQADLDEEWRGLTEEAARASDAIARAQLELAAQALATERTRREALALRRTRFVARLKAQVALLESARGTLLELRSGEAQAKAAGLAALSERLGSLTGSQRREAEVAEQITRGAELERVRAPRR